MKLNKFNKELGSTQQLPKTGKHVIVVLGSVTDGYPDGFAVGYLKFAAGDVNCPYFVVQGIHNGNEIGWIDCLPDEVSEIIRAHNCK